MYIEEEVKKQNDGKDKHSHKTVDIYFVILFVLIADHNLT